MSRDLPQLSPEQLTVREEFRKQAGLPLVGDPTETLQVLLEEVREMARRPEILNGQINRVSGASVLFAGQAYYSAWFLSRELRKLGWTADLLDWAVEQNAHFSFGYDFGFTNDQDIHEHLEYFIRSVYHYSIFHFSNAHGISFGGRLDQLLNSHLGRDGGAWLLKNLGKRLVYSNNGCLDGVSQTSFARASEQSVCSECRWQGEESVCSDFRNLAFGARRNALIDFGILLGGNRLDWNADAKFHEVPHFYCLDPNHWAPTVRIPRKHRMRRKKSHVIFGQGFGAKDARVREDGKDIKSHYIYDRVFHDFKQSGQKLQLLRWTGIHQSEVRYYIAQSDVIVEMLTYGWFGAQGREAMMMGKPVVCYLRPEWIELVALEHPDYVSELPIVSATPATASQVLRELAGDEGLRRHLGAKGRAFALKWHSSPAAAQKFDEIYSGLLAGVEQEPSPYPSLRNVPTRSFTSLLAKAPQVPG